MEAPVTDTRNTTPGLASWPGWAVHAFTATSAIFALLSLLAIEAREFTEALLWLLAALAVDGIDGTLARAVRIRERVPDVDGEALDLIVDFLTYVFVPTLLIIQARLVAPPLAVPLAALILLSSLYLFTRKDMKTEDGFFRGFPSLWNVVAFYLFAVRPGEVAGTIVVLLLAIATFAPIHFVHPFRARGFGPLPPVLAILWLVSTLALLWPEWGPGIRILWLIASVASALLIIGIGVLRSFRGPR
jgi:phosphatidylcholine synthase